MNQELFIKTYIPKLGLGMPTTVTNVQVAALVEVLIAKGVLTREGFAKEIEVQFQKLAQAIDKTPVVSPIQPHR